MTVKTSQRLQPSRLRLTTQPVVAVMGTGSVGMRHLEVLKRLQGVGLIAVPRRQERISQLEVLGYAAARDLDDALTQGATHCIIATDTGRHVSDALAALERGLGVLVEKPLAPTAEAARPLNEAAARAGRGVFVGCVLRFSESLGTFRDWLPQVGRLHAVWIECQSYLPDWRPARPYQESYSARVQEGGVLLDLIHEIDYAGWIFGWPSAVQATVRNLSRLGIAADEIAELHWESPTAGLVCVRVDYLTRPSRRWIRACGEHGTIEWDGVAQTVTLAVEGVPAKVLTSSQARDEMFRAQAQAFLAARRGHTDAHLATGGDGLTALAVCDAARRASDQSRQVQVIAP